MKERTQPTIAPEDIRAALSQIKDPDLGRDIVTLGFVKDLRIDGENVSFALELTTPACPVREQMKEDAHRAVLSLPGVRPQTPPLPHATDSAGSPSSKTDCPLLI